MKTRFTILCLFLLSLDTALANDYHNDAPPVVIANSIAINVQSKITHRNYQLQIALPNKYYESNQNYPVVYLLDANNDFPLVTSISRRLYQEDNLNPIIIVGISYNKDAYIHRFADYTPTKERGRRISGHANQFFQAIEHEFVPLIEKRFRIKENDRAIAGHSLGGLFGAYQLIKDTSVFSKYIISSPSLWWDNFKTLEFAAKSYKRSPSVFISVGGMEGEHMKSSAQRLEKFIRVNLKNSQLKTTVLNGETHGTAKFRAYADSLRWLYKGD